MSELQQVGSTWLRPSLPAQDLAGTGVGQLGSHRVETRTPEDAPRAHGNRSFGATVKAFFARVINAVLPEGVRAALNHRQGMQEVGREVRGALEALRPHGGGIDAGRFARSLAALPGAAGKCIASGADYQGVLRERLASQVHRLRDGELAELARALDAPETGRAASQIEFGKDKSGKEFPDGPTHLHILRDAVRAEQAARRGEAPPRAPIPGATAGYASRANQATCEKFALDPMDETSKRDYAHVQVHRDDSTGAVTGETYTYTGVTRQLYKELPRVDFILDGRGPAIVNRNSVNGAPPERIETLLREGIANILDYLDGDEAMLLRVSQYMHQGALSGIETNFNSDTPFRFDDGTSGYLRNVETNWCCTLSKNDAGEPVLRFDYELKNIGMMMADKLGFDEDATRLDRERSHAHFTFELTLGADATRVSRPLYQEISLVGLPSQPEQENAPSTP